MLDVLERLSPILFALMGWLFGILTPGITTYIRDRYRSRQLMKAIVDELSTFQLTMASVALNFRSQVGQFTNEYLDEVLPIFERDSGNPATKTMLNFLRFAKACAIEDRIKMQAMQNPMKAPSAVPYSVPLLVVHASDLAICPTWFQRLALRIRYHADNFNSQVPIAQKWMDKAFDSSGENKPHAINNLRGSHEVMMLQADAVVRLIEELRETHSKHASCRSLAVAKTFLKRWPSYPKLPQR